MIVGYTARYQLWGDKTDRRLEPNPFTPKGFYKTPLSAWEAIFASIAGSPRLAQEQLQKVEILAAVDDATKTQYAKQYTKRR
jgi:hypothetical protein